MTATITRKLVRENQNEDRDIIDQEEIAKIADPVIILGDPGLGKSVLCKALGDMPGIQCVRAGTFKRTKNLDSLIEQRQRIVIDGLDEIASSTPGGGIDAVLTQLSAMGQPAFVLSCREADWRGAADRVKIQDDYGSEPILLHLQPFERADAHEFLTDEFPELSAGAVLDHLEERGLEGIYKNPLTLKFFGEVAQSERELPETRAELLDRACRAMLKEENPRHAHDPHVHATADEILQAAGAMFATQLLCDRIGVYSGPTAETPNGYVNVAEIAAMPLSDRAGDALKTRLFEAEGEHRSTYIHRVVAEFLGAKWLAACFDRGCSQKRIFALLRHGDGVPTSLRGLHAWIAHFSTALASRCIATDPYAVLRYGDAEKLRLTQARDLLIALKQLSDKDPYFRSEDWGRHPASGLMRPELKQELLSIICTAGQHTQLSMLLIDAMIGTPIADDLADSLHEILFDPIHVYAERLGAAEALHKACISVRWEDAISYLLELADANSVRLAYYVLLRQGASAFPIRICVDTVLSRLGLTETTVSDDSRLVGHLSRDLFTNFDTLLLPEVLDRLVASAKPVLEQADPWARSGLADLVRHCALQILEADQALRVKRFWTWISAFYGSDGHDQAAKASLTRYLQGDLPFRTRLLKYVLLEPCASNTWMAGHALVDAGLGLYPTAADIVIVLKTLQSQASHSPIDRETWRHVLLLVRSSDGLPEVVRATAIEIAEGDAELLAIVDALSSVTVPEWKERQRRRDATRHARRAAYFQVHRELHAKDANSVVTGEVGLLAVPAAVYLGRSPYFDDSTSPHLRVLEFLGDRLGAQALGGFIAVFERTDLPSARDIAEIHCQHGRLPVELLLICGIAEMIRRGHPLDTIDESVLAAAFMAWRRSAESNSVNGVDIGSAIEDVLFESEKNVETHFRASIEPQLASQSGHVIELYQFTREERWRAIAADLAVEWLEKYPSMPVHAQRELMMCALVGAPKSAAYALLFPERDSLNVNNESLFLWLLAYFVLQFDKFSAKLEEIAADNPDFLWLIRDLAKWPNAEPLSRFSISQHVFIVRVFGVHWPDTQRPTGVTSGDTNAWDASEFIRSVIFSIAGSPAPEATNALQSLIDGPATSYGNIARRALAQQRQGRRDYEYTPPTLAYIQSVMTQGLPETLDDMRAYFLDLMETLQYRMHGTNTDMWEAYWVNGNPRNENFCRNRLIEQISGRLPDSIRFEPEMHMPGQKRADIAAIRDLIGLPVEIKCQWHKELWNAATEQLDAKYARDWRAQGRGVYIVIWFGCAPGIQLRAHPDGVDRPNTPETLRQMLADRLPEAKRSLIDVFVLNVARPS